jgi:hypothetical protein
MNCSPVNAEHSHSANCIARRDSNDSTEAPMHDLKLDWYCNINSITVMRNNFDAVKELSSGCAKSAFKFGLYGYRQ